MDARVNELSLDLEEIRKFEGAAQRESVKAKLVVLRSQVEQELEKIRQESHVDTGEKSAPAKSQPRPKIFTKKITTYAWDQSDKFVKIFVSGLKGVQDIPKENVTVTYDGRHYSLNVSNLNNHNYVLSIPKLLREVENPNVRIKTDEVVVMLKKKVAEKWDTLSEKEKLEKDEKAKKDEAKFDKNTDDPSKGIMDLMKKMYDDGDDEMKRTIAKAWTESRDKQMSGEGLGI